MSITVVIADDSAMSRKITMRALPPDWDANVVQVNGGGQALDYLRNNPVDLLLLDLTMPEVSGMDVLQTILYEEIDCPVIVISADVQPRARARVRELGALAFLSKPLQAQALAQILSEAGLR